MRFTWRFTFHDNRIDVATRLVSIKNAIHARYKGAAHMRNRAAPFLWNSFKNTDGQPGQQTQLQRSLPPFPPPSPPASSSASGTEIDLSSPSLPPLLLRGFSTCFSLRSSRSRRRIGGVGGGRKKGRKKEREKEKRQISANVGRPLLTQMTLPPFPGRIRWPLFSFGSPFLGFPYYRDAVALSRNLANRESRTAAAVRSSLITGSCKSARARARDTILHGNVGLSERDKGLRLDWIVGIRRAELAIWQILRRTPGARSPRRSTLYPRPLELIVHPGGLKAK